MGLFYGRHKTRSYYLIVRMAPPAGVAGFFLGIANKKKRFDLPSLAIFLRCVNLKCAYLAPPELSSTLSSQNRYVLVWHNVQLWNTFSNRPSSFGKWIEILQTLTISYAYLTPQICTKAFFATIFKAVSITFLNQICFQIKEQILKFHVITFALKSIR